MESNLFIFFFILYLRKGTLIGPTVTGMYVEESPISFAYAVLSVCLLGFVAEICVIYEGRKVAKLTETQVDEVKTSEMFDKSSEVRLSGVSL